jgi:hypothetical protein
MQRFFPANRRSTHCCNRLFLCWHFCISQEAAANAAKAAAPASKQQDAKKVLQRDKQQEQIQQQLLRQEQRKAGGRDTERTRDIKRGKVAQDDKQHQVELDAARKKGEEAKDDAAKVRSAAVISAVSVNACRNAGNCF